MRLVPKLHYRRNLPRTALPCALVMLSALTAQLSAQATTAPGISIGQRVRIVGASTREPVIGTLLARRSDSLVIGRERDTIAVRRSDLWLVDRSVGTHHEVKKMASTGMVIGAAVGAIASAVTWRPCVETVYASCLLSSSNVGDAAVVGGIIGVVPGLLVGAIAGLAINSEKWVPVGVASLGQLRVLPRAGGVVAQMSFSFH